MITNREELADVIAKCEEWKKIFENQVVATNP